MVQKIAIGLDTICCIFGLPDAGIGELAGLPVSFQNVKKP